MERESRDAANRLWEMADILRPWAIRVAATLRLADHITAGHTNVDDLARVSGSDHDALRRLLRYLESQELFVEDPVDHFQLTDVGRALCDDDPAQFRSWLDQEGGMGRADVAASGMLETIRGGLPTYSNFFGRTFWDDLEQHPQQRRAFDELMMGQLSPRADDIAAACNWDNVRHVVDVGGGTGVQLAAILERAPHVRGTLVELPRSAEQALALFHGRGLSDRTTVVDRSFFEPLPRDADVYILNIVLHNWPDSSATEILQNCVDAATPAGRLLVIEALRLMPPRPMSLAMDLHMLVLFGGRQRSLEEFGRLFHSVGVRQTRVVGTVGARTIIECFK